MRNYSKKFLAILLTLCMLIGALPFGVLAAETTAQIAGRQLMLGDDLCMHFYTKMEGSVDNAKAAIYVDGKETASYDIAGMTAGENGYDLFVHLGAPQMTDEIKLVVNDGQNDILTDVYSVREYAIYLLENNYSDETKALVKELLNYGAKAQLYFSHKTGTLANAGYEIETNAVTDAAAEVVVDGSVKGISYYGSSMVFRSQIAIRYYFSAPDGMDGYTVKVNGTARDAVQKNGLYYVEINGIMPDDMGEEMTVEATDGTDTLSFTYSPKAYIARMYNKDTSSDALKALLAAANSYFDAAAVFTGVAENRTGSLSLGYRYGTDSLIQVNTNLPSDTPCANFTAGDNGCDIDQSANLYQQFGWVGMDNADGTIVLTFHFNNAFAAGQTYTLPKGAVFGFTDNSSYTLDKDYTFTFDGSGWSMTAEDPAINLTYRYGTDSLIQFNTDLPSDTPCVNFTAGDNGCDLKQAANKYQQVGWIGMDNVDGTIVLTFHFNSAFTPGQSYVLPQGAVFGFTDGSSYELKDSVELYWNGSNWSENALTVGFSYRYGTNNLIQVNTDLPSDTPCVNFTADQNGCNIDQSGNKVQWFGWAGMENVDGTTVITFHFNSAFTAGQSYTLKAGSVFGFTDGSSYVLDKDYTFYFDGAGWSTEAPVIQSEISLTYRYGTEKLIQFNTNLPATTALKDFLTSDNGCNITQSGDQQVGYVSMLNDGGTIVLTFNFNSAFAAGQSYTLKAGSVFGFTDGSSYVLDKDYTFYFDGSVWGTEPVLTFGYRYGTANLIQVNTNLPASTPIASFTTGQNGCSIDESANQYQNVGWIGMANADGTIVLTFNFNSNFAYGQSYCLPKGAVFGFTDGSSYKLDRDYTLYFNGTDWSETAPEPETPADVLDESNFTGGKEFTTFADLPADYTSADKIQEYKELGFNTSLLGEDHLGGAGVGAHSMYTASMQTANAPADALNFQYRYGTNNLIQVNTDLPSDTPCVNFTTGQNGCSVDESGNTVQWVGWIGMDNVDGTIVLTFHFNNAFAAGQSYVLPKGAVFGFTDGSSYKLDADYTFTFDGTNWSMESSALRFSLNSSAAKYIQLKTNIPTGLSYGDFLPGDTSKGNVILETTDGAQAVGWYSYSELDGGVYLTLNFGGYNKAGTQYILKAGTSLKAGDKVYTTDRDYVITVENDYLSALNNLNNAGLDIWIRNYTNKTGYFGTDMTSVLLLYRDLIDGFYMVDEAFETNELLVAAGQENVTTDFQSLSQDTVGWFNTNFAGKYFHSNHVPISSYDHYSDGNGNALSQQNADYYRNFLTIYKNLFNKQLDASGSTIGFDNYPFNRAQTSFNSGIADNYLLNGLIAAQVAGEYDFSLCIQTFEASGKTWYGTDTSRDITDAAEVSMQLYTGMALGADVFEYFAYGSNDLFKGILNQDGTKRLYDIVKEGNQALCFSDVINTFSWNGIVTSAGSSNSANGNAFSSVAAMVLTNISNGVLDSYSSTDDAVIGCFTKGELNGYMVVNFNDPKAVTGTNTVSLTFADCTRARIYTEADGVLTSTLIDLTDGSCSVELAPGSACFVIPA